MSQRHQHIDLGQRECRLPDSLCLGGNRDAQLGEQPPLDLDDLFLRVENLGFVFFQFGRGEALRAHQSLLAFVILRNQVQIRFRNLEVVAEDGVELHLERSDARPATFPLLDLRQHLLAVAGKFAQFVQAAIHSRCNHTALGKAQRRLGHNRLLNAVAQIAQFIE